jgi:GAF domain-containing protein
MPLDVADVHQDRRFQADFDERLAYQTKDVFCLPVFNREGNIIGVLELLNRSKPLNPEDKEFLSEMCSYLGAALQNAWAHREVAQTKDRRKPA